MCIQNNPNEARNMLLQNPQLAYALLQAQIVMKIVDPQVALVSEEVSELDINIVDSVKFFFFFIFDSDREKVWALLVRWYFIPNHLDLLVALWCPELSTCQKTGFTHL